MFRVFKAEGRTVTAIARKGPMKITRRDFVGRTAAAGLALGATALSAGRVFGANDRINVGIIGFGLIGRIHTRGFLQLPDARIVALAETFRPRLEAGASTVG